MVKFIETEKFYFAKERSVGHTDSKNVKLYRGTKIIEIEDTEEKRIEKRLAASADPCVGGACKVDVPFGRDWFDAMMGWSKKDLVGFLKKVIEEKNQSRESDIMSTFIEYYGVKSQIIKALSELNELALALHHNFFDNKIGAVEVVKEIADVEIVCKSLRLMYGEELVNIAKANTYERLEAGVKEMRERIKEGANTERTKNVKE